MTTPILDTSSLKGELDAAKTSAKSLAELQAATLVTVARHLARRTERNLAELRADLVQLREVPPASPDGPTEVVVLDLPRPRWRHVVTRDAYGRISEITSEPIGGDT